MVIQKFIKVLNDRILVKSRLSNVYKANFDEEYIDIPDNIDKVEIEFINNIPIVSKFYLKFEGKSLKEQEEEF